MTPQYLLTRNDQGRVTAVSTHRPAVGGGLWLELFIPEDGTPYAVHGPFLREDLPADALAVLEDTE